MTNTGPEAEVSLLGETAIAGMSIGRRLWAGRPRLRRLSERHEAEDRLR
jgi:hypothetical protein